MTGYLRALLLKEEQLQAERKKGRKKQPKK
jgi:hypothetical protein